MKDTFSKKALLGTAAALVAATALGTWGITYASMKDSPQGVGDISETGNKATSSAVWFTLGDSPEGWQSLTKDPLEKDAASYGTAQKAINNKDASCTYSVSLETIPTAEFSGTSSDYLAMRQLLSYGENMDAKNPVLGVKDISTSAGKVPFQFVSFGLNVDIDGDGKKENTKNYYLAHAMSEITDTKKGIPMIQIAYTCSDEGKWSEATLNSLLEKTTINITGDPAPPLNRVEAKSNAEESVSPEVEASEKANDLEQVAKSKEERKVAEEKRRKMIEEMDKKSK